MISLRPSKNFMYKNLITDLASRKVDVAVDAASSGLKNRKYFNTKLYVGLDIDNGLLEKGLIKFSENADIKNPHTVAVHCDLTTVKLATGSVDLLVSSNTIEHLPAIKRLPSLVSLFDSLHSESVLILTTRKNSTYDEIKHTLLEAFDHVHEVNYRNRASRLFESLITRNGRVISINGWVRYPVLSIVKILGFLERALSPFAQLNVDSYFVCTGPLKKGHKQNFHFGDFIQLSNTYYRAGDMEIMQSGSANPCAVDDNK